QDTDLRKQLGRLLLQPLDSGADRDERIGRLTLRALHRWRHREAAMVADEATLEPVIDQPGVAIRTGEPKSALPAERERGIAAAIEEEERLFAAFDRARHRLSEPRGDEAAARRAFGAQIDRLNGGKIWAAEALREMHAGIAPTPRVDLGLDRRRRRPQHHPGGGPPRPHPPPVA